MARMHTICEDADMFEAAVRMVPMNNRDAAVRIVREQVVPNAGAMVPFFAGRVDRILPPKQAADMRKFYVDTAILGNPRALDLAVDYYGASHVLFGMDAPLGILPAGATKEILTAINEMHITEEDKEAIRYGNYQRLIG